MKHVWQNWWMHVVAGLLIAAITVLPWLWIGNEDGSVLPHGSDDGLGLVVVFAMTTLLGSWFTRRCGRSRTGFAVVTAVGFGLGMLALGFQGLLAFEPGLLDGQVSQGSVRHLWAYAVLFVASQTWYFLSAKLQLPTAVLFYATLTVAMSYWLQIIASLVAGAQSYYIYLWYAGPLLLGLILGYVGFLRATHLIIWILALAIQWAMPAIYESTARVIESDARGIEIFPLFWTGFTGTILDVPWQTPLLVSLATAMLTSVVLLIARKIRRR